MIRAIQHLPCETAVLFEDETTLRWLPPLRHCWQFQGQQANVPIHGRNAKRTLFGAINFRTGHRVVWIRNQQCQGDFVAFLEWLRARYQSTPVALLLDKAPCHDGQQSVRVAKELDVRLLWLPKQCSELNAMDQLWRELKRLIAANRQFPDVDNLAETAHDWIMDLTPTQARRKAGILSHDFWLKQFM